MTKVLRILFFAALFWFAALTASAQTWQPWEGPRCAEADPQTGAVVRYSPHNRCRVDDPDRGKRDSGNFMMFSFRRLISFFQENLSPLDGPKCPHYPTCSAFSKQSISKYGALFGVLMTADRLMREYPGLYKSGHYPLIVYGMLRVYDPPELEYLWNDPETVRYYSRRYKDITQK